MAQTVIGIFDDASEAQTAVQELMEAGFSRQNIDLSTTSGSDMSDSSYSTNPTESRKEDGGGISGFFSSLFGMDDDDDDNRRRRDNYTSVGERNSIVTVHVIDRDEAERAADILDDAGAIDVDERAEQYRTGSYSGSTGGGYGSTNVTADPLAPAYGASTGITTGSTGYVDTGVTDRDVMEENLNAGKRTLETDGERLRSRIVERPVEESVRLREERVKNLSSTGTGYNTTVDPERDVTNR
jgi:hypothetical protein